MKLFKTKSILLNLYISLIVCLIKKVVTIALELTSREEFLINLVLYLQVGNGFEHKKSRNQSEIENIFNDKQMFIDIDVIKDELNYFGLETNDFTWSE